MSDPFDLRRLATNTNPRIQLTIECVIVSDPAQVAQELVALGDVIERGGRRRSGWFEGHLARRGYGTGAVRRSPVGGAPSFHDRTCCYQHVADMERRIHQLQLPYQTRCPECRRLFEFRWTARERR